MPQLFVSVQGVEVKQLTLQKDQTTLGRRPGNDIVLDNMIVSGRHCVFHLVGLADVFVEDLGSTNGTYVNDHMIHDRTLLHDGDGLSIGPFRIRYVQANEQPTSTFGETAAMTLESLQAPKHAFFTVTSGSSAGLEVPVVKAVTTFGRPGISVVSVSHRRNGYFVSHLDGSAVPLLNGQPIPKDGSQLSHQDVLELAGTRMLFQLRE